MEESRSDIVHCVWKIWLNFRPKCVFKTYIFSDFSHLKICRVQVFDRTPQAAGDPVLRTLSTRLLSQFKHYQYLKISLPLTASNPPIDT